MIPPTLPKRRPSSLGIVARVTALGTATLLALAVVEGLASLALFLRHAAETTAALPPERSHSRYDPELGWVQVPGMRLPDLYGPGLGLTTNARGFRGEREVAAATPPGRVRVVCSGDSFVLGFGVRDEDAWCRMLEDEDPRIESVNMGQGGYGTDQAYLWFLRDGVGLERDLHLLALSAGDFARMELDTFLGCGRPRLEVENGRLGLAAEAPALWACRHPRLVQAAAMVSELRIAHLIAAVARRLGITGHAPDGATPVPPTPPPPAPSSPAAPARGEARVRAISAQIFSELAAANRRDGSSFALVFLPMPPNLDGEGTDRWRGWTAGEATRLGIPLVDLVPVFRERVAAGDSGLFHPGHGHFTVEGNRLAARTIAAALHPGGDANGQPGHGHQAIPPPAPSTPPRP